MLILLAIKEVVTIMLRKSPTDITSFENSSLPRRIDRIAKIIEKSLCNHPKNNQFSIKLDEFTLLYNEV